MTRTLSVVAAALGAALLVTSPVRAGDEPTRGQHDQSFLKEAASAGLMEVELGRMANEKSASERVKQFGQHMVDDHSKANTELKEVASKESVALPTTMNEEHREMVTRLSKLQGAEFDRAYMQAMLKDHETDVGKFRDEAKAAQSPNVKAFAAKTLPTLESHLQMAKQINASMSGATSGARPRED